MTDTAIDPNLKGSGTSMRKWLMFASSMMMAGAAHGARWLPGVFSGHAPDRMAGFFDADSIRRDGNNVEFWIKSVFEQVQSDHIVDQAALYRANCLERTLTRLRIVSHHEDGTDDSTAGDLVTARVPPHSNGADLLDLACGRQQAGAEIADPVTSTRRYWVDHPND